MSAGSEKEACASAAAAAVVSEMRACRMRLIIALFHAPVESCW
jgi:hypothetical protein